MSASPPCSPPRRPLHERSNSQNNSRHGIRLVPYSPPRPSDEGSTTSSRPVSYASAHGANTDPEISPAASPPCSRYGEASPTPSRGQARASVSGSRRRSSTATTFASSASGAADVDASSYGSAPAPRRPSAPRRRTISISADSKTFSIVPLSSTASTRTDSLTSPPSLTTISSIRRVSSLTPSDGGPSVPLTPLTERSFAPSPSPSSTPTLRRHTEPEDSSPWNYRMVGGLRKVAKTPDVKQKQRDVSESTLSALPSLVETTNPAPDAGPAAQPVVTKKSSHSSLLYQSDSAISEKTNYKVYAPSSPVAVAASLPPSSSHSNYQVLGESSSSDPSVHDQTRPQTGESNANYVVHGGQSASSSIVTRNRSRSEYSQESLVVPPLRPVKRRSLEHFGSRDSLRRGSLSSISNVLTQEATRTLFASSAGILQQTSLNQQDATSSTLQMIQAHPHQWSSQLSTVMSESEPGTESRSLSPTTSAPNRRSSGFNSSHSRQVLSISSSLLNLDEHIGTPSHSRSGSLDRPQASYNRAASRDPNSGIRLVRDHDEDGDGLADLEYLQRPSRGRMGSFLSPQSSDRNLRSSASSRSRANSFNSVTIPTWAKLYYGSGERRYLAAQMSSDSMFSQYNDSQPGGSSMSRTPSHDQYNAEVISPRRRPRDLDQPRGRTGQNTGSMDIAPASDHPVAAVIRNLKKQTSSIWSPHLARDRRAARFSMWEPPTANWSVDKGLTGRRNAQITMFVVGFIFPISWFMAALFPLPRGWRDDVAERGQASATGQLDSKTPVNSIDEDMIQNIKWWRRLNRGMSVLGILVLGAVVALVVVGVRQRWGS